MKILRFLAVMSLLSACTNGGADVATTSAAGASISEPSVELAPTPEAAGGEFVIRSTSGDQSGNRVTVGAADLDRPPTTVQLDSPQWVVGVATDTGPVWFVAEGSGEVLSIAVDSSGSTVIEPIADGSVGTPLLVDAESVQIVVPSAGSSPLTAPLVSKSGTVSVSLEGVVTVVSGGVAQVLDVVALGDSRIVMSADGLGAILTDPTADYPHGVLGDRVESASFAIFDPESVEVLAVGTAPDGTVFEAISPMWADVDDDGRDEILLTASDDRGGARLVVYDTEARLLAQSPPIGNGSRWRNLLGVGPLGPNGETRIVDVQTPHIGGIVQWFSFEPPSLVLRAAISSFSTHRIGSRNLDQGVIVDTNGDGRLDVLVPSQDQTVLVVLTEGPEEAEVTLEIPLEGSLATNVSAVRLLDGRVAVALGLADGRLLIWD